MNVKDEIDGIGEHTRAYREETVILPTTKPELHIHPIP
jgi:hypothetical protein